MIQKPHLTHVALWTTNMDQSVEFYRKYCGLELVHERQEGSSARVVWVGENRYRPRFVIVLIEARFEPLAPNALAHFGFSCHSRADVDAKADTARSEGILAMEPRDAGPIVGYYCIVKDPDGNSVEFSYGQTIDPGFFRKPTLTHERRKKRRPKAARRPTPRSPRSRPSRPRKR